VRKDAREEVDALRTEYEKQIAEMKQKQEHDKVEENKKISRSVEVFKEREKKIMERLQTDKARYEKQIQELKAELSKYKKPKAANATTTPTTKKPAAAATSVPGARSTAVRSKRTTKASPGVSPAVMKSSKAYRPE